jgi:hypothetical protein
MFVLFLLGPDVVVIANEPFADIDMGEKLRWLPERSSFEKIKDTFEASNSPLL